MNRVFDAVAKLDVYAAAREAIGAALDAVRQMELRERNAARYAAYQRKLQAWRETHPEEYYERLRRGLAARWKWHRAWERRAHEQRRAA